MPVLSTRTTIAAVYCVGAWLLCTAAALAQDGGPQPMPTVDRLAAPTMPPEPTQADYGALTYYYVCMSCHGDRGQGLTDEFRALWAPGDQNCWQAKCHGANHPEYGFELVRYVPPVIGEGTLARSLNAQQLYSYISAQMPWQAPGTLTEEETWQLTAFLLRANGVDTGPEPLGPAGVDTVPEPLPEALPTPELPGAVPHPSTSTTPLVWAAVITILLAAVLATIWVVRRARSSS